MLFCPGIPGSGKTIIAAIVVDNLFTTFRRHDTSVGIAYWYCDFRRQHEQKPEHFLANLMKQLARQHNSIPNSLRDLYHQYKNQPKRPTTNELFQILRSIMKLYSRVFIVVDGLDEYHTSDRGRARFISSIFELKGETTNVFSTSRRIPEIEASFKDSISLEIRAKDEDVQKFLEGSMKNLPRFVSGDPNLQQTITVIISQAVHGMYVRLFY